MIGKIKVSTSNPPCVFCGRMNNEHKPSCQRQRNVYYDEHKTNLQAGRLGIDSVADSVFFWWPHKYFYDHYNCPTGLTEKEYLDGVHEFTL